MDEEDVEEIAVDLRRHNGSSEVYSKFYEATAAFIGSEETKVDDRRHQGLSTLPVAWSVPNFIKNVVSFSREKSWQESDPENRTPLEASEVPTAAWVRLLFCPSNAWVESSKAYKCKFNLRFKLLSRKAQHEHIDSEYAARVFKHVRSFACELKKMGVIVCMIFADDKCSCKVGEVGDAVAATERNRPVINGDNTGGDASQHDFAQFKINPTVMLLLKVADIPDDVTGSFYRGTPFVGVKDAVFQASSPMRHATEMKKVLEAADQLPNLEALLLYTDGESPEQLLCLL